MAKRLTGPAEKSRFQIGGMSAKALVGILCMF
jgi:hypothetical protein